MKPRNALTLVITLCCVSGMFAATALAEPNVAQSLTIIDERLKQLSQQIEALQFDQQQMQKQITDLQAKVVELHRAGTVSATDMQALDAKIKANDAAREKDKQAILDAVAKEIAAIGGRTNSSSATPTPTGDSKEYVVQKGDTLTSIAKANGVTVALLKKVNNLTTDALQVGQKLVISKKVE